MSIRKRTWTTAKGEEKTSWVVDYVDGAGVRRLKTFRLKKEADAFSATATVEVREGVHVAESASATVSAAGKLSGSPAARRRVWSDRRSTSTVSTSIYISPRSSARPCWPS
jgi:integrase